MRSPHHDSNSWPADLLGAQEDRSPLLGESTSGHVIGGFATSQDTGFTPPQLPGPVSKQHESPTSVPASGPALSPHVPRTLFHQGNGDDTGKQALAPEPSTTVAKAVPVNSECSKGGNCLSSSLLGAAAAGAAEAVSTSIDSDSETNSPLPPSNVSSEGSEDVEWGKKGAKEASDAAGSPPDLSRDEVSSGYERVMEPPECPNMGGDELQCRVCQKLLSSKYHLIRHMAIHTGDKPFRCDQCEKRFTVQCSLKRHMLVHSGQKPFMCGECFKQFPLEGSLRKHMGLHTELQYQCSQCKRNFPYKSNLKRHLLQHTGEKSYSCTSCERRFLKSSHLRQHLRVHTGETRYVCDVCQTGFSTSRQLRTHQRTHGAEGSFWYVHHAMDEVVVLPLAPEVIIEEGEEPLILTDVEMSEGQDSPGECTAKDLRVEKQTEPLHPSVCREADGGGSSWEGPSPLCSTSPHQTLSSLSEDEAEVTDSSSS